MRLDAVNDGVLHEFMSIPDVLEDVTEIILNLKKVRRSIAWKPRRGRINVTEAGTVLASDIEIDGTVEVLTPDQHIATVNQGGKFVAELTVRMGGYVSAEENKTEEMPVGTIPVDSMFSPIRRQLQCDERTCWSAD